jgi:hypothetical protein
MRLSGCSRLMHFPRLSALDVGFFRSPGPGLGNLLFPISRALIGAKTHGGEFIYPTMRQIKFGTFLRRERDKRTYGNVLRPRNTAEWLAWWHAPWKQQVNEDDYTGSVAQGRDTTVIYEGLRRHFHDLGDHRAFISDWLKAVVVPRSGTSAPYDIAVHVRLGDFQQETNTANGRNIRQSTDWYKEAIERAQTVLGERRPRIVIFTDGNGDEVQAELGVQSAEIDTSNNALQAILRLSEARILVTSRSSFSMWGAYLGGMPAIWNRDMDLAAVFPMRDGLDRFT